ncbi:hypothetical protein LTR97_007292 [Elasticomyces elasticus]|uniref:DUF7918 domain-containing protein n=1 Tax=Elasticomyces elasticus TaxID=574655 RepID=A0AAN7W4K9_9PEZI|nr:hypothetical protein LTR97_007292 [Elasticomyces elasticus]
MVALDGLPGVDVSIVAVNQPLTEYEDRDDEDNDSDRTITRYIEAVTGQIFAVRITVQQGFRSGGDGLAFYIHVDGSKLLDCPLVRNEDCRTSAYTNTSLGCRSASDTVQQYRFTILETASDRAVDKSQAEKAKDFGTIVVKVMQVQVSGIVKVPTDLSQNAQRPGVVSEKLVKGQSVSHSVDFSPAMKVCSRVVHKVSPVQGLPNPYTTVVFRYRSLETLKSMLIIPRTPSPPPLEERDYESVNRDEFLELQRQLKELKEKAAANVNIKQEIKRERTDDNPRPRKVARPNRASTVLEFDDDNSVRESSTATFAPRSEVVDLTDD